jgi:hypothetical protein
MGYSGKLGALVGGEQGLGQEGFGGVAADAVFAAELGFGQGALGLTENDERGAAAADGKAEAGSEGGRILIDGEGAGEDVVANAAGEEGGVLEGAAGEGKKEFVFAAAADEVVAAELAAEAVGDFDEDAVAGFVAVVVVDAGEIVEVEEHEAEGGLHALDAVGFLEDEAEESFTVPEAGEAVVGDVVAELGGLLLDAAGEGEYAFGDADADAEIGGVERGGLGGKDEEVIAAALESGADAVRIAVVTEEDVPGAALFVAAANFPHDFHRAGGGQIHVEESDGGGRGAVEAGQGFASGGGDVDLIVPGLQGIPQEFKEARTGRPDEDNGAGADSNRVGWHEVPGGGLSLLRVSDGAGGSLRNRRKWRDLGQEGEFLTTGTSWVRSVWKAISVLSRNGNGRSR